MAWDPVANQELWRLDPGQTQGIAALAIHGNYLFGMSRKAVGLFSINPATFEVTVVVAAINGGWYSGPHITADEDGLP
ncbi:hypothetical protein ACFRJ9_03390 [Paenarthrobacter sp. NPDC056912]|uniref:hypothetical protein n=1 Tax=Paenarthrobacter sp. NPDC056912 TaxID=3345965 RepID=UPI00366F8141